MKPAPSLPAEQHNIEIELNRTIWGRKPVLRAIYRGFYEEIAAATTGSVAGETIELGSGMGNIKQVLPHCMTTDIFNNAWLDRVETAYALSFPNSSVGNLIMFDVFHHLEFAGRALEEAARVVVPGGRLIIFDHDMGLVPHGVCRAFHHEPVGMGERMRWDPPAEFSAPGGGYYAATGNAHRCFVRGELSNRWAAQWRPLEVRRMSSFAWLASGGFRGRQLFPTITLPLVQAMDRLLSRLPGIFSARLLVVLERRA